MTSGPSKLWKKLHVKSNSKEYIFNITLSNLLYHNIPSDSNIGFYVLLKKRSKECQSSTIPVGYGGVLSWNDALSARCSISTKNGKPESKIWDVAIFMTDNKDQESIFARCQLDLAGYLENQHHRIQIPMKREDGGRGLMAEIQIEVIEDAQPPPPPLPPGMGTSPGVPRMGMDARGANVAAASRQGYPLPKVQAVKLHHVEKAEHSPSNSRSSNSSGSVEDYYQSHMDVGDVPVNRSKNFEFPPPAPPSSRSAGGGFYNHGAAHGPVPERSSTPPKHLPPSPHYNHRQPQPPPFSNFGGSPQLRARIPNSPLPQAGAQPQSMPSQMPSQISHQLSHEPYQGMQDPFGQNNYPPHSQPQPQPFDSPQMNQQHPNLSYAPLASGVGLPGMTASRPPLAPRGRVADGPVPVPGQPPSTPPPPPPPPGQTSPNHPIPSLPVLPKPLRLASNGHSNESDDNQQITPSRRGIMFHPKAKKPEPPKEKKHTPMSGSLHAELLAARERKKLDENDENNELSAAVVLSPIELQIHPDPPSPGNNSGVSSSENTRIDDSKIDRIQQTSYDFFGGNGEIQDTYVNVNPVFVAGSPPPSPPGGRNTPYAGGGMLNEHPFAFPPSQGMYGPPPPPGGNGMYAGDQELSFKMLAPNYKQVYRQVDSGQRTVKRLTKFYIRLSRMQNQFALEVENLTNSECSKLQKDTFDRDSEFTHAQIASLSQLGNVLASRSRLASRLIDKIAEPVKLYEKEIGEQFEELMDRDKLLQEKLSMKLRHVQRKKTEAQSAINQYQQARAKAAVAPGSGASRKGVEIIGSNPTPANLSTTDKFCELCLLAIEKYEQALESARDYQNSLVLSEYPDLVQQFQEVEESRFYLQQHNMKQLAETYHAAPPEYYPFPDSESDLVISEPPDHLDVDEEIRAFTRRTMERYPHDQMNELRYSLSLTKDELKGVAKQYVSYSHKKKKEKSGYAEEITDESIRISITDSLTEIGLAAKSKGKKMHNTHESLARKNLREQNLVAAGIHKYQRLVYEIDEGETKHEVIQDFVIKRSKQEPFFRYFLKKSLCQENLEFYHAVVAYFNEQNPEILEDSLAEIFDEYLYTDSNSWVNLPAQLRESLLELHHNKAPSAEINPLLESALTEIVSLMNSHSFPKFLKSKYYLSCLKRQHDSKEQKHVANKKHQDRQDAQRFHKNLRESGIIG